MNRKWLEKLASNVEAKYGKEIRDRLFGDLNNIKRDHKSIANWFKNFNDGMNELDDKSFLTAMMAEYCPCRYPAAEEDIRKLYSETENLEEFVMRLDKNGVFSDIIELRGNILYATKQVYSNYGKHNHKGPFSENCHCSLGSHAEESVSDIFCHCCTVGYYSKMFKNALGVDVKVEFVDSVITGGRGCTAAIYLPPMNKSSNR